VEIQSSPSFGYKVETSGDTTFVRCRGRLVSDAAGDLKDLIKPMISHCAHIVVDLEAVNYVDSSGLGALVSLKVAAQTAEHCELEFINFTDYLKDLLSTTMLSQFLGAR
jgi:anti-anti-sigma factor